MTFTRRRISTRILILASLGALLSAGCTQWQYPWRKAQKSGKNANIAAKKADEPPPTPMVDPNESEVASQPDPSHPEPSTELNEMLARLRAASSGDETAGDANSPLPESRTAQSGDPSKGPVISRTPPTVTPVDAMSNQTRAQGSAANTSVSPTTSEPKQSAPTAPVVLSVRVGDRSGPTGTTSPPYAPSGPSTMTANQALRTESPRQDDALNRTVHRIESAAEAQPSNVRSQWQLSLLKLASGETPSVGASADGGAATDSALLDSAVRATAATGTLLTDPMATHDEALDAVDELRDALRNEAELRIPVVALCSRVDAFGVYEELPDGAMSPNRVNRAIVYGEVRNFASESKDRGYRTLLSSRLELFTADGRSVWRDQQDRIEDFCRRRREDFFIAQMVTLPVLSPGEYVLKMTITDLLASKTNQATKAITVGGTPAMTASRR